MAVARAMQQLPLVEIPPELWDEGGALSDRIARLSLEHGPIFRYVPRQGSHAGVDVVYMVGPEANRFVMASGREHFSHALGWTPVIGETLGMGLLNMDPPEHTRHRAMMNPAFTSAFMARYLPIMQRVIEERTRDWVERGQVDLAREAREITFDVAAAALVGFETGEEVDLLRERFNVLLHGPEGQGDMTWEEFRPIQQRVRRELAGLLLELIAARRAAPAGDDRDDVLGMMVRARDEEGRALTDAQLLAHVNILLVAGHETTTTLGAWLLYLLAQHLAYLSRVVAELEATLGDAPLTYDAVRGLPVLTNAIKEAGRLESPVMLLPRGVLADFEFNGYQVPAGTFVYLAIAAGHRLPTVFADPGVYDPDRFEPPREEDKRQPYGLVTFGGGSRICIGVNFAQIEVKALASHVLRRYRLELIPDRPVIEIGGIVQFLPDGLPVRVYPRV